MGATASDNAVADPAMATKTRRADTACPPATLKYVYSKVKWLLLEVRMRRVAGARQSYLVSLADMSGLESILVCDFRCGLEIHRIASENQTAQLKHVGNNAKRSLPKCRGQLL
jgi:hypothetical protein